MSHALGTTAADYSRYYYEHSIGACAEPYAWSSPHWRTFFTETAGRLVALFPDTATVLDVGSASGLLVQAFVEHGVDAVGLDLSDAAIEAADPGVRDRLTLRSATDPIEGRYDLVTCIEVLEHMAPADAEKALDHLCAATDRIIMSSTPEDFAEPTHVNVHPPAHWAAAFAQRGFYRRADMDLAFLSPWAVVFERASLTTRDVVHRYETLLAPLRTEVAVQREELLKAARALADLDAGTNPDEVARLRAENLALQHEILRLRDHAIGADAAVGTAQAALERSRAEVEAVRNSETFRLGRAVARPVAVVKRGVKKVLK